MTRVLVLTNQYPPHHLGGYELSCADVMGHLAARGHDISVLTTNMRRPGVADPPGERDRRIWRDLRWWWDDHELTSPPLPARLSQEWRNQRRLLAALREVRPDVVSVWNLGAMSLGLVTQIERQGIPMVFAVSDEWPVYAPLLDAWSRLFARPHVPRALGRAVTAVSGIPTLLPADAWPGAYCFVSESARFAAEHKRGWTMPYATVVYSGISRADFPLSDSPPLERPWSWRLLFVGRVEHRKGIATAVRALAHLPDEATLTINGPFDPNYVDEIEALITDLGMRDRVHQSTSDRAQLHDVYRAADVFVFPSEWNEPFGLVPIEAMACDTPVVATGTGGSREFLVDGTNCVLYERGDPAALAAAVRQLAVDASLREKVIAGGRATAAAFGTDTLADIFEAWHDFAASGFRGDPPPDRPPIGAQ
jgi:glycosyltransferase involved in cell wall biosynthesis